jgi:tetratricopeptide (TPR) repeat protein
MRSLIVSRMRSCLVAVAICIAGSAHAQVDEFQPQVPANEVQQLLKARMLRKLKQPKEAIPVLQALVARQPDYFNAQYELGLAISDTIDDIRKAIPELEKAAALKRRLPEIKDSHVFNSLGWAYMYTGQTSRAEAAFKEAESQLAQLEPDVRRRLYNNLGVLYLNTGRRVEANKYLLLAAHKYGSTQAQVNLRTLDAVNKQDKERFVK